MSMLELNDDIVTVVRAVEIETVWKCNEEVSDVRKETIRHFINHDESSNRLTYFLLKGKKGGKRMMGGVES
jgi:hypothetical protein